MHSKEDVPRAAPSGPLSSYRIPRVPKEKKEDEKEEKRTFKRIRQLDDDDSSSSEEDEVEAEASEERRQVGGAKSLLGSVLKPDGTFWSYWRTRNAR